MIFVLDLCKASVKVLSGQVVNVIGARQTMYMIQGSYCSTGHAKNRLVQASSEKGATSSSAT